MDSLMRLNILKNLYKNMDVNKIESLMEEKKIDPEVSELIIREIRSEKENVIDNENKIKKDQEILELKDKINNEKNWRKKASMAARIISLGTPE